MHVRVDDDHDTSSAQAGTTPAGMQSVAMMYRDAETKQLTNDVCALSFIKSCVNFGVSSKRSNEIVRFSCNLKAFSENSKAFVELSDSTSKSSSMAKSHHQSKSRGIMCSRTGFVSLQL